KKFASPPRSPRPNGSQARRSASSRRPPKRHRHNDIALCFAGPLPARRRRSDRRRVGARLLAGRYSDGGAAVAGQGVARLDRPRRFAQRGLDHAQGDLVRISVGAGGRASAGGGGGKFAAAQSGVLSAPDRAAIRPESGLGADDTGLARHRARIQARDRVAGRVFPHHRRYRRRVAGHPQRAIGARAQLERIAATSLHQSSASRGASVRGHGRQGRDYARSHRRGDRRIRWLERGARISLAQRHLPARYAAGVRRPVRLVGAGHIRLCAGGNGRTHDVGVAAASAGATLKSLAIGGGGARDDARKATENAMSDQNPAPPMPMGMPSLAEVLLQSNDIPWREKSLAGVSEKMLWRDEKGGSSIALIKFA